MDLEIRKELEQLKNHDPAKREGSYQNLIAIFTNSEITVSNEIKANYLRELCSDDFLFYKINDGVSNDSVGRSFSVLTIALILSESTDLDIEWMVPHLLRYIELEKDFRGKVAELGWIHCLAHLGDLLSFLAENKRLSTKSLESITVSLINKIISLKNFPLCYGEDYRLAIGIFYALKESLSVNDHVRAALLLGANLSYPERHNIVNVIRCLYIELLVNGKNPELKEFINKIVMG